MTSWMCLLQGKHKNIMNYERILRRAGKQLKGGKIGTEIGGGSRKIRIHVYLVELERSMKWMCNVII